MKPICTASVGEKMSNVIEALSSVNINKYFCVIVSDAFFKTKGERVDESETYFGTTQSSPVVWHFKYNPLL